MSVVEVVNSNVGLKAEHGHWAKVRANHDPGMCRKG